MRVTKTDRFSISTILFGFLLPWCVSPFAIPPKGLLSPIHTESPTSLLSEKKRRRRKNKLRNTKGGPSPKNRIEFDELPDFDLVEDTVSESKSVNDPEIFAVMASDKGNYVGQAESTKDLLRTRNKELEDKLVVNEITEVVPSLGEYMDPSDQKVPSIGKKAAKRQARRAAAMEIKQSETESQSFFDKLPFFTKEKEEKSFVKLLEEGTWACIYALIAWEIYINSPLFERSAPLAPVVFTDPITVTMLL